MEIVLKNQESCVIKGGITIRYFELNGGARQEDPIVDFLFILEVEILFLLIKKYPRINGLNIFNHCYLYSGCAVDTTFFLKGTNSIKEQVTNFHISYHFSGLRPNLSKCDFSGIGVQKGVKVAVCGIQCVDLFLDKIKVSGTYFSYNEKLREKRNFSLIMPHIQHILKS